MVKITSFKELIVWEKSISLVEHVYTLTSGFPQQELFGLTSQMRRSAVSIPSNIAEGHRRNSTRDFIRFLYIANASAAELETQLIISKMLYNTKSYEEVESLLTEIQKMLAVMIRKLQTKC